MKCRKQNWSREVPCFQTDDENSQLVPPPVYLAKRLRIGITELVILYSTLLNILEKLVYIFPNKITRLHRLQRQDYAQRITISRLYIDNLLSGSGFLRRIALSDACVFQFSGVVNTQNNVTRIWGTENRKEIKQHEYMNNKAKSKGLVSCAG